MKHLSKYKLLQYPFLCLLIIACNNSGPTEAEQKKALITSGTWKIQNVLVDGADQSQVYKGLTITFTDSGFTTSNGGVVWPATGSWSFKDDKGTVINRNDGVEVELTEVTASKLVIKLTWTKTTLGPGRMASVKGNHTFTFSK